jgi:putative endonuclease
MPESAGSDVRSGHLLPEEPVTSAWSVYIVRCSDDSFYTGIATDVARRLGEHESGIIGAKYLRGRTPLELVFEQQVGDRSLASKIEHRIKKLPRHEKANFQNLPARIHQMIVEWKQCQ